MLMAYGFGNSAALHKKLFEFVVWGHYVRVELNQVRRLVSEAFFHGRRLKDLGNGTQVATLVIVQADAATENSRLFSSQFFTLHTLTLFETSSYRRLDQRFINSAIAVVGEADKEVVCVTFTYHSST